MPEAEAGTPSLPPLREVIKRHGLRARKSLGQCFLLDLNLTDRISRAAAPLEGRTVLEVGPGPGGLTRSLLAQGAHVVAIEKDRRCLAALAELAEHYPGRLDVIESDALEIKTADLVPQGTKIVANLPYNIATPLLFKWFDELEFFTSITVTLQKEVAQRLTAEPGTKSYGRLAVMTQWRCEVTRLFDIEAQAFTPPPKVTSTVVQLTPRAVPVAPANADSLERIVKAAFGQRRKMLRSSLKTVSDDPVGLLTSAGVDPTARAEELDVETFCVLARRLDEFGVEAAR
ncbi:MAG: 16S rRNA (adenine(1518)-N(6)/adenine(1519)-N(6))-dimethyltransferase [Rhodospirillaceae bacterium]|nr:16S rRNA (adenine(1518)-N(6)/adenine(1519)-N(6))-dimethyltransferase [Rhodospirillaceae bacterium]MDP6620917.1 16S rRNA (adenine(1518)-N(6)/adenine(1519)-N(6))-dimethyltransferase RsmA [Alphaproteobacteria bacterium]|tara:strand:- start:28 stop:888 length:861 start_codon:yes stop_codon:yes gene_type:complete